MAASRNIYPSTRRPPKINHDPLHNRLAGILAAFFLCPHFNLYKILKVHHFSLDFLFAGFIDFADLLIRFHDYILNSFVMAERHGSGKIYDSRLSNGPIESINRKVKDLKRAGRGYRNFEHFRSRFLFAARRNPVITGSSNSHPVSYYQNED